MRYDSDAEDTRLLEEGRIDVLLAKYEPSITGRCVAKLRGSADADDVAQDVRLRLLSEFHRGRRYGVPYRVVVHQVIGWTIGDYFAGRPTAVPLPEMWEPSVDDGAASVDSREYLTSLFEGLPPGQRQVLALRYLDGLEPDEIALEVGKEPNAVYQALHNGHKRLREVLVHG